MFRIDVLTHMVSSNRIQRSLAVQALNHWTTYKDHASVSYIHFKGRKTHSQRCHDIDTEHERNPPYLACILCLRPLQLVTCTLRFDYVKIKSHALIALSHFFSLTLHILLFPSISPSPHPSPISFIPPFQLHFSLSLSSSFPFPFILFSFPLHPLFLSLSFSFSFLIQLFPFHNHSFSPPFISLLSR